MNTNPDEATLALWLDDELTGESLAAVEAWAQTQPEQLAARESIRRWRGMMTETLPATEEPPFPDFFNSRVMQAIQSSTPKTEPTVKSGWNWKYWFMPAAACAGMVMAFFAGRKTQQPVVDEYAGIPRAIIVEPALYTPESGVEAEWFASKYASATVIVLKGVAAIPDSFDFSETAYQPVENDSEATAYVDLNSQQEGGL
jgi:hypothetical protein